MRCNKMERALCAPHKNLQKRNLCFRSLTIILFWTFMEATGILSNLTVPPDEQSCIFWTSSSCTLQVKISYMEIYNEVGYDLLDSRKDISSLEDLERVRAMELEDGKVFLRNLALHSASSDEQALNLVSWFAFPTFWYSYNEIHLHEISWSP